MTGIQAFHHVALWSSQFDRTVDFYVSALGLTPRYQWGEPGKRAIILRCGDRGHVEVFERPAESADSLKAAPEARLLHLALETDDVDGMYRRAMAAGARSRLEPKDVEMVNQIPGQPAKMRVRIAFVHGLNDEIIEFFDDRSA